MADIASWLQELGLGEHAPAFAANGIDFDVLADLTDADLKELGLGLGDRKRLLRAVAARDSEPAAPAQPARREAERRQLTVMFVDLVGSTALAARLDPETMSQILRDYQNAVAGEISRYEGHVAKFMGDGVLAYFGWPHAHEDDAERSVRAALAIVAAAARLRAGDEPLSCRIGIATGLVVVGDLIGEGSAREETVVGDTPNLAARLQALADPGAVVVADATRRLLGDLFRLHDLGPQSLKGIAGSTPAFAVLGERALESRFAARRAGVVAAIVGRDQELALLLERWRQARSGEGQLVLLTGEAGIGKSRLTEALVEAVAADPHVLIRYQCSPYHADSALYPTVQHLSHASRLAEADTADGKLDRLEALLAQSGTVGDAAPLLADLLGLDGSHRYAPLGLTLQQRRTRTLAVLVEQFVGLAAQRPVLWVVEDAHWIDPTTLELIELALDAVQASASLVVVTARPTFAASFASHPIVTRLALNRLARAATQAIVARITGGKSLPGELLDEIAARTDGVPLFVEEMTKAVLESGALRETSNAWLLEGSLSALAIPTSLHDSLMARLDRLHPVKEVAQTAAVIGRSFDHATIAALSRLSEAELNEAMRRLVEAELVFRRGAPPDATYLFKHALVRDAAYESLLKSRRATLHGRLVDVLEADPAAAPEVKAQHAEAAGLQERALDYWEEAGTRSLARPAYREAIASLENAIGLCRSMPPDPRWRRREQALTIQLGQALIASSGYSGPATLRAFDRALELADELDDASLQLPALYGQWAGQYIVGVEALGIAQRFSALADRSGDVGTRLVGLRMLGLEAFHAGRYAESLTLVRQAIALYDPEAHRDLRFRFGHDPRVAAGAYRAWNLWHQGLGDQALQAVEDNRRWVREVGHANTTGLGLCYGVAIPNLWMRRVEEVVTVAREVIALADQMSMSLWHAWGSIYLGWAMSQGSAAAGLAQMESGLEEARMVGAGRYEPLHLSLAAEAYARAGRQQEAEAWIAAAFASFGRGDDAALEPELHRTRAAVLAQAGRRHRSDCESDLRRALDLARARAAPSLELRAARDLARLLAEGGERGRGRDLLAPVRATFTEGLGLPDVIEADRLLADLG
ncbi:MAG: adenylate/guanylate cyclase domain-containing protein [Geminicoccaceae bacterium]